MSIKKRIKKSTALAGLTLLTILILATQVSAFGLVSPHIKGGALEVKPGESAEYRIQVQNVFDPPTEVAVVIESPIAVLKEPDRIYVVGGDNPTQDIYLVITAPENAVDGDEYTVSYAVTPATQGESAQAPVALRLRGSLKVRVNTLIEAKENAPVTTTARPKVKIPGVAVVIMVLLLIMVLAVLHSGHEHKHRTVQATSKSTKRARKKRK